jgi:NADH-quinone oxidoreductase subunit I
MKIAKSVAKYIGEVLHAAKTLLTGMKITGYYFFHPKEILTQQYPENRETLKMFERFRGEVVLIHDENNEHKCTGCSACELACPNGTIEIINKREIDPETGKSTKAIDKFVYHLQMCTFCNLCIIACPTDAIKMAQNFEHAVFDRAQLTKVLNKPGSKLMPGIRE